MSLGVLAPVLMAASAVSSFAGGIMQGNSQQQALNFNAQMAEQNASMQTAQAEENAARTRRQVQKVLGEQKVAYGKAGLTGPTMEDVASDTLIEGELEAMDQLYQGKIAAYNSQTQASLYRAQAKSAKTAGYTSAIGGLLQGAGSAYFMYNQMNPKVPTFKSSQVSLREGIVV